MQAWTDAFIIFLKVLGAIGAIDVCLVLFVRWVRNRGKEIDQKSDFWVEKQKESAIPLREAEMDRHYGVPW